MSCRIGLETLDPGSAEAFELAYGPLTDDPSPAADIQYLLGLRRERYLVRRAGTPDGSARELGQLLRMFDRDLSVELQKLRSDLYFIHAGVLELAGKAALFVGPAGAGKSTTCWGLSHHGFGYLSDELAPVELENGRVLPYARALCLKRTPPAGFPLPPEALTTPGSIHVPVAALPGGCRRAPAPVGAILFVTARDPGRSPELERITSGEAAARLYANALNPLAHPREGLEAAARIAEIAPSWGLQLGELSVTCEKVAETIVPALEG